MKYFIEIGTAVVIDISPDVINAVDDKWRSQFYALKTPEEIAEHIAYNMVINGAKLSQLDGWADKSDVKARIIEYPKWALHATKIEKYRLVK
jgi:hypothetical protein